MFANFGQQWLNLRNIVWVRWEEETIEGEDDPLLRCRVLVAPYHEAGSPGIVELAGDEAHLLLHYLRRASPELYAEE